MQRMQLSDAVGQSFQSIVHTCLFKAALLQLRTFDANAATT